MNVARLTSSNTSVMVTFCHGDLPMLTRSYTRDTFAMNPLCGFVSCAVITRVARVAEQNT